MGGVTIVTLILLAQAATDVTWIERGGIIAVFAVIIYALYTGKVLPRNVVPREDYDKIVEGLKSVTSSLNELVTTVRYIQRNGKNGGLG